ncbi:TlpA disulfide reductase family protein [Pedobacter agri]|uniref:TlpA family protein disulfide reductase n=1 Tax=Pedobacter agri TaxID=454586 RepID=UPI00292FE22A|nr:TlpA disulfide reductase family protein [Pedobacter agri]
MIFTITLLGGNVAIAQLNAYEQALSKFTGGHKYDIEKPGALDGVQAPDFSGHTLDGKLVNLAQLKGKVVVLNFWFIACKPCKLEVRPLNEIVKKFRDKEVLFLSIAREKREDLLQYLEVNKFEFSTIADPKSDLATDVFHVLGYPTTIVIDRTGKIRYYSLGGKIDERAVRADLYKKLVPIIEQYTK